MFGDKFIQIATFLPTDRIYGFGENLHHQLKVNDLNIFFCQIPITFASTTSMCTRRGECSRVISRKMRTIRVPSTNTVRKTLNGNRKFTHAFFSQSGVQPFYMGLEPSRKAHGMLIFNSNAQEYTIGPAPHLIYRCIIFYKKNDYLHQSNHLIPYAYKNTILIFFFSFFPKILFPFFSSTIGGQLELFFFPGPTPELVIQQYQQLVGRPYLPAYWAFGFQLCRYGYDSLANVKAAVERTRKAGIPFDVQYAVSEQMKME